MISRVLVANRAEIASRVFATCRRLGISTVAVHSDADVRLPFVRDADFAVRLPGTSPGESYLRADLVIEAAKRAGADAIHPGYGFLSENAAFARAVLNAGLTWIGPPAEAIEAMGSKIRAKQIMRGAGVPVLEAPAEPSKADFPLLVKASAGGGGRGMRVVRRREDLDLELEAARAESEGAFGDGTVFVEPYVERGRHVEVQVVGTSNGVIVFGDRDCSVQRRHQKVIEEAPAPGLAEEVRAAMHAAARATAEAVGYLGAGTVEFLYDPDTEAFYFLEMNTRLQVEHPVTEAVFGVDLVELQIGVAEGRVLGPTGNPATSALNPTGHSLEVRIYAEDPAADYQPQSGLLTAFDIPHDVKFAPQSEGEVRLDAGYAAGIEVSTHYDAMLAKVIVRDSDRRRAIRRMAEVLRRTRIHGVGTNIGQLLQVLGDPAFVEHEPGTDLLATRPYQKPASDPHAAVAAAIALAEHDHDRARVQRGIPVAWRNVVSQPQITRFEEEIAVEWYGGRHGYVVDGLDILHASASQVVLAVDGVEAAYDVAVDDRTPAPRVVHVDGPLGSVRLVETPRFVDPADQVAAGSLLAPMPGTVVATPVESGTPVSVGQAVLVLEAMKMQHTIKAPTEGTLTLEVATGQQVSAGDVLAVVTGEST